MGTHAYRRVETRLVRERSALYGPLRSSADVETWARERLKDADREHVLAVYLDARHKVIAYRVVSIGTQTGSFVDPGEVFGPALAVGAVSVIVVHNHPSGDPSPSPEDRSLAIRLGKAGQILARALLDFVVVGHDGVVSFAAEGYLPAGPP